MQDKQDPLQQIWQNQPVALPDLDQLKRQWRKVQVKQRIYFALDAVMLLLMFAMFVYIYPRLNWFSLSILALVGVASVGFTLYVSWLRRLAFGNFQSTTDSYVDNLQRQLENNIKIARITKHSMLPTAIVVMVFHFGHAYFDQGFSTESLNRVAKAAAYLAVIVPSLWYWAKRRMDHFKKELAKLKATISQF